ncbi:MAG: oxidoreductase [Bacteroidota bacterium]
MSKHCLLLLFGLSLFACHSSQSPQAPSESVSQTPNPQIFATAVPSSVRAIEAIDEQNAWFAGSGGVYGFSHDAGQHWTIDSIRVGELEFGFRALAITVDAKYLLSTGSPAMLFRSRDEGQNWELKYQEDHPDAYYNALKFWDAQTGIAVGDPTEANCLSVLMTRDGGESWFKIPCGELPPLADEEAGFAASNTNIALSGDHAWLVTGGQKARVFHSPDRGLSWEVFDTPIQQGGQMTGIYSIAFRDDNHGIIWGGDWNKKDSAYATKAITADGGNTWALLNDGKAPAFRSCVQYVPRSGGQKIFAIGSPGMSYSDDGGDSWTQLNEENFYSIRINNAGKTAWLAGRNKVAYMSWQ